MRQDARMLAALFERSMGLGEAWEVSGTWFEEVEGGPDELHAGVARRRGHAVPCPECGVPCGARDARERTWRHPGVWQSGTHARRAVPVPWEVRPNPHLAALLGDRALAARARGRAAGAADGAPVGGDRGPRDMLGRAVAQARGSADHPGAGRVGHRRDQPPGGPHPHTRHARPRRREVRAARPTEATGHRAPNVRPDPRPTAATGRRSPRSPVTCRAPLLRRPRGDAAGGTDRRPLPRHAALLEGDGSRQVPRAQGVRREARGARARQARVAEARGEPGGATAGGAREARTQQEPPRVRPRPARRPRRRATPADGRRQGRRGRCPTGCPAGRRAPTSSRRGGSPRRSGRREGIPGYLSGRPADAYPEGANSLIQSIKKAARGFRNVEYLATAIFPGLGGLPFDALACAPS